MKYQVKLCCCLALSTLITFGQEDASESVPVMSLEELTSMFGMPLDGDITTVTVADGLHVLFGSGGNIAVSIGESGVLIVDDQFPEIIPKVNAAIEELGGGAVDFAINTHWHFDHADGNKALGPAGTWIVAHEHSAEKMSKDNVVNLVMAHYLQEAYPPKARPVISFGDRMTFHFNGGDIELIHAGAAHTAGDLAAFFKKQNAIHFGDVFNNFGYPFIDADNGGGIDGMIRFCETIYNQIDEHTIVIPGHGALAKKSDVADYITMLKTARGRVQGLIDEGKALDEIAASDVNHDFAEKYADEGQALGFINRVYASLTR